MNLGDTTLTELIELLRQNRALARKEDIQPVAGALAALGAHIDNGDDAAAIPDRSGFLLLAAEGMAPEFVRSDPWFAGFCAVMTNVSDIAAMGGRPTALVDVLFSGDDAAQNAAVLGGLAAGAELFGVPLVGGHTGRAAGDCHLAAAVLGRARRLITSFDARPGDAVVCCVDLRGAYRGETCQFDAVSGARRESVRAQLELLPRLAESAMVHAGKDISMAGMLGTLAMLLETSGCGAVVDLAAVPAPVGTDREPVRWLSAFPSFGYLLVTRPEHALRVCERCEAHGLSAGVIAEVTPGHALDVTHDGSTARYRDLRREPLVGFARTERRPTAHA